MSTSSDQESLYKSLGLDPTKVTSHKDGTISYGGGVNWDNRTFKVFPLKFRRVTGDFSCRRCTSLVSLEGAPQEVRDFSCGGCTSLLSLVGAPQEVSGDFFCGGCTSLLSLVGAPQEVSGDFFCSRCTSLVSLEGVPQELLGNFYCGRCTSLVSLKGGPQKVASLDLEGTSIYVIPEDMVATNKVYLDSRIGNWVPTDKARETLQEFKDSIKSDEDAGEVLLDRMNRPLWQVAYATDYLNKDIQV